MNDSKDWYRSKTIWGGVVALGAAVAGLFGIDADPADVEALTLAVTNAAAAIGALVAIAGRFDADTTIR